MKATKKPVTIEYFKYDGDLKNSNGEYYVPEWAVEAEKNGTIFFKDQGEMYIKTLEGDHHASAGDIIIRGVNGELYPCKPEIFEKTYDIDEKTYSVMEAPETSHGFDWAIQRLKAGKKVQRKGWNGKSQYIELATSISYKNAKCEIINCNHDAIGNKALAFVGTSGVQMGWLASQADMLAEDWQIAE